MTRDVSLNSHEKPHDTRTHPALLWISHPDSKRHAVSFVYSLPLYRRPIKSVCIRHLQKPLKWPQFILSGLHDYRDIPICPLFSHDTHCSMHLVTSVTICTRMKMKWIQIYHDNPEGPSWQPWCVTGTSEESWGLREEKSPKNESDQHKVFNMCKILNFSRCIFCSGVTKKALTKTSRR